MTNEDVHQAAVAADASKLNLTLLQQMAESKAKYIATEKARKENSARLIALRAAQEVAEAQTNTPSIEADIRSEIDLVASDTVHAAPSSQCPQKKRTWTARPESWKVVAEHFDVFGRASTFRAFLTNSEIVLIMQPTKDSYNGAGIGEPVRLLEIRVVKVF